MPTTIRYHIPMRIAFFGGSFDPPHLGHLAIAHAARQALALDQVLFAPVGLQPLKPLGSSASFEDRAAMVQLAIASEPSFALSLLDAPKPGQTTPNYTVETLQQLRQSHPHNTQLFLLLGADSLRTFHHWHRAAEIPFLAHLIVASRPNESLAELQSLMPPAIFIELTQPSLYQLTSSAGAHSQLTLLPDLHYEISATALRQAIQSPSAPQQIPPPVLEYIHQHRLYT
jgi:nicotinate-nucleotide adenylyltransferase